MFSSLAEPIVSRNLLKPLSPIYCGTAGVGQKRCYFEKQSGEVVENTGPVPKNKPEQTGKQSGEVIENRCLWKKLTGIKPENKPGHVVENTWQAQNATPVQQYILRSAIAAPPIQGYMTEREPSTHRV